MSPTLWLAAYFAIGLSSKSFLLREILSSFVSIEVIFTSISSPTFNKSLQVSFLSQETSSFLKRPSTVPILINAPNLVIVTTLPFTTSPTL